MEDPNEVLWALTTRFQPATDMFMIPRGITSSLEPSATADGLTSKLMLDLTIKENFRGEVAEPTDGDARNGFADVERIWIQIGARRALRAPVQKFKGSKVQGSELDIGT